MFNGNKEAATKKKPSSLTRDASVTILTSGCHFNGKLYCSGSSRIGGKIEGQVISEGILIIEEDAVICADIRADEAIIQGKVTGKLEAAGRVELCASSRFDGDICSPILVISEGAQFNGRSTMRSGDEMRQGAMIDSLPSGKNDKGPQVKAVAGNDKKRSPEVEIS